MRLVHPDLAEAASRAEIVSPTAYAIGGERREVANAEFLLPALEQEMYARLYTRAGNRAATPSDFTAQREHVAALSAANNGRGTWEPGWRVEEIDDDGHIGVRRDDITFWTTRQGVRTSSGRIHAGDFCRVWVGKEMRNLVPGFYFAYGNGDVGDRDVQEPLVRFYWHLTPGSAVRYIESVTSALNALGVPFRTKVLSDAGAYVRADAGVLYVERLYYAQAAGAVVTVHRAMQAHLRAETPMFTKVMAPGLGLAEDPRNGMSFGQSRCRLVARGLWDSHQGGGAREEAVAAAFRSRGFDPARPYLERQSADIYGFGHALGVPLQRRKRKRA